MDIDYSDLANYDHIEQYEKAVELEVLKKMFDKLEDGYYYQSKRVVELTQELKARDILCQ